MYQTASVAAPHRSLHENEKVRTRARPEPREIRRDTHPGLGSHTDLPAYRRARTTAVRGEREWRKNGRVRAWGCGELEPGGFVDDELLLNGAESPTLQVAALAPILGELGLEFIDRDIDRSFNTLRLLLGAVEIMWRLHHHHDTEHSLLVADDLDFELRRRVDQLRDAFEPLLDVVVRALVDLDTLLEEPGHRREVTLYTSILPRLANRLQSLVQVGDVRRTRQDEWHREHEDNERQEHHRHLHDETPQHIFPRPLHRVIDPVDLLIELLQRGDRFLIHIIKVSFVYP